MLAPQERVLLNKLRAELPQEAKEAVLSLRERRAGLAVKAKSDAVGPQVFLHALYLWAISDSGHLPILAKDHTATGGRVAPMRNEGMP